MTNSEQAVPGIGAGCGAALREAREAAGMSIEQAASQLRMTVRSVANLETDDWSSLGASVFVRGQLRSYARLLGVDIEPYIEQAPVAAVAPSTLVSHTHTPGYQRFAEQMGRRIIYIAITAAIAIPVWLHFGNNEPNVQSLDVPVAAMQAEDAAAPATAAPKRTPLVASIAALPAAQPAAALAITFNGDSWVEIYAADNQQVLERGLLTAGQHRSYKIGEVGRIKLGNVDAVEVKRAGAAVDLAPFSRANVARFTLSSDGSLAPVAN
ncbi:helix-turn-helix domain-containing protein [Lysobacter solisilvae (ex Woo and Kim 2020)]|uniref:Helix-turn-helix domain-containing protein n=1 Tax=Agrilutibacter terrestris TaxID=2865112 RepID=A0A7H0FX90_9GAMM|nr:helix-turn-helix domain-containing protein [Lysobacter terrestris]QNP40656.1 helix-turn-helix domain-containing protein [Lysobacter terrestris]